MVLDVVCGYVLLFLLDRKMENRLKSMFNVGLAGDRLYGKRLFTWLSMVMSLMLSYFVLSFCHEMAWMRSGIELSQFLRTFPPTFPSVRKGRRKKISQSD